MVAGRLGLTSFGGPVAHLGYFREEYVRRRGWLDDATYADLVALCQFLPGPASSQLGIAIGTLRAGVAGGVAAWVGFTLPSAIALAIFALATAHLDPASAGWLHGLMLVAAAVVIVALVQMARRLTPDLRRIVMALVAAAVALAAALPFTPVALIAAGSALGLLLLRGRGTREPTPGAAADATLARSISRRGALISIMAFGSILVGLAILRAATQSQPIAIADVFYRSGSLVFGGGHAILPLLHDAVVPAGWISNDRFLAGYGAAQAVPGPLLTFAAYLGAAMTPAPNGFPGATIALVAIFLPSFLLVFAALPFWTDLRSSARAGAALAGANAVVVGLLLAALWNPIWTSSVHSILDVVVVIAAVVLLAIVRLPPWLVVILGAVAGAGLQAAGLR